MAIAHMVRSDKAMGTHYLAVGPVREEKSGLGDGTIDAWFSSAPAPHRHSWAIDYDSFDGASSISLYLPNNTIVLEALLRVDEAYDAGLTMSLGDTSQATGWLNAVAADTVGLFGANGVYNSGAAVPGTTGPQIYTSSNPLTLSASAVPTQGKAIVMLLVAGYAEDYGAEWDLL